MILTGILLAIMPLATAMVLHGLTQMASAASKPVTLLALGALSFAGLLVSVQLAPNVERRGDGAGCGALYTMLQLGPAS